MPTAASDQPPSAVRHRPKALTVFAAAFVAGAAAAVGVNRVLDVHLAQAKPQLECEPIFVALRALPQGVPVTVWDVALRDWPKAMMPAEALRAHDSFEGSTLRYPLREGQPLLAFQLVRSEPPRGEPAEEVFVAPVPRPADAQPAPQDDLWTAVGPAARPVMPAATPATTADVDPPAVPPVAPPAVLDVAADAPTPPIAAPAPAPAVAAAAAEATADVDEPADVTSAEAAAETVSIPAPAPAPAPVDVPSDQTVSDTATDEAAAPTLAAGAKPPVAEPPVDPLTLPSVVNQEPTAAPVAPTPPPIRYLVVPERIALQADTSFAPPPASPATAASGAEIAVAPTEVGPGAKPAANRQAPPKAAPRTRTAPQRSATQPPAAKRPVREPATGRPTPQPRPRTLGDMFPNVSAALEAVSSPWQRMRDPRAAEAGRTAPAGSRR